MKRNILIIAVLACFLYGCEKQKSCSGSPFSPIEISWTECNDVKSVVEYFKCHDSTIVQHKRDSVLVCGYITLYNQGCWLVDDTNNIDTNYSICFSEYLDSYNMDFTKKYYIKTKPRPVYRFWDKNPCCLYEMMYSLFSCRILYTE